MKGKRKILVFDPIDFAGGSKTAALTLLKQVDSSHDHVVVLTNDVDTWEKAGYPTVLIREMQFLRMAERGVLFYIRQIFLLCNVSFVCLRHKVSLTLGTSGPGVDFALFLYRKIFGKKYFQCIQGPVSASRSIALALANADLIGVLQTEKSSLEKALATLFQEDKIRQVLHEKTLIIENGLDDDHWPKASICSEAIVYWAASLLQWKGLSLFTEAFKMAKEMQETTCRLKGNICYIRPKSINIDIDEVPDATSDLSIYESPENLDEIRAASSIFVSTSHKEPFGLSILEAMAAGLCVILPEDGAYWDQQLTDGHNVLKYSPGDAADLAKVISKAATDVELRHTISKKSFDLAQEYRASLVCLPMARLIRDVIKNQ